MSWTIGDLPANRSVTLLFDVTVDSPFPAGIPQVEVQGTLASNELPDIPSNDPDTGATDDPTVTEVDNPAKVVINEIDYDQPGGTDAAEFVELKNVGSVPVDLDPFMLDLVDGSGAPSVYQSIDLPAVTLAVGDYFVVCSNAATVENCDFDVSPDVDVIQDGAPDAVALTRPGTTPNGPTTFIHDTVSYEGDTGAPYTETTGAGLEDPAAGAADGPDEDKGLSRIDPAGPDPNDGSDTDHNANDFSARCITPGAANTLRAANCARPIFEQVTKTAGFADPDGDGAANPGDVITYSVSFENTGGVGLNTAFADTVDPQTTLDCASITVDAPLTEGPGTTCDAGAGTLTLDLGDVPNGGPFAFSYQVRLAAPLPAAMTEVTNQGTLSADDHDPAGVPTDGAPATPCDPTGPTGCEATTVPVNADPALSATKTDALVVDGGAPGQVNPGDLLEYTITVLNSGGRDATGVLVRDAVPAHTSYVPGSLTSSVGGEDDSDPNELVVTFPADLAGDDGTTGGATATITFRVEVERPIAAGVEEVANQGQASAANFQGGVPVVTDDPDDATSAADPTVTPVEAVPDLSLMKDDGLGGASVQPGDALAYTLTYHNTGDQDASGARLTETVPAGTTFDAAASTPGWTCAPDTTAGAVCTLALGTDLAGDDGTTGGATGQATFTVVVENPLGAGLEQIDNTATIADDGTGGADPTPAGNTATLATPVAAMPLLSATMTDVLIDDPASVPASVPAGAPAAGGKSAPGTEAPDSTPTAAAPGTPQGSAGTPGVADPGDRLRYEVTVSNTGDQDAPQVVFALTVDAATRLDCASVAPQPAGWSCDAASGALTVPLGTLAGQPRATKQQATAQVTFEVTIAIPFPAAKTGVQAQGRVTYATPGGPVTLVTNDPETPVLQGDATVTAVARASDLSITKTAHPADRADPAQATRPFFVGELVVFDLAVTNHGPLTGVRAEVEDRLPEGLALVAVFDASDPVDEDGPAPPWLPGPGLFSGIYDAERGLWQTETIPFGGTVYLRLVAQIEGTAPLVNTARLVDASAPDPNAANDQATAAVVPVAADLALEKALVGFTEDAGAVRARFRVGVVNRGPSLATGVVIAEALPAGAQLAGARLSDASDTYDAQAGLWTVGTLGVGETATLELTLTAPATTLLANAASVAALDQVDPRPENDVAGAQLGRELPDPGRLRADLSLVKTVSASAAAVGERVTYRLAVTNGGPFATAGVAVQDVLPAGVRFVSATASQGTYDAQAGLWQVGAARVDSTYTLRITVEIDAAAVGQVVNVARITASHLEDPDSAVGLEARPEEDDEDAAVVEVTAAGPGGAAEAGRDAASGSTEAASGRPSGRPSGVPSGVPSSVALGGAYPNPFNPRAVVPYGVPARSEVELGVYDVLGRRVAVLVAGVVEAGWHAAVFEGGRLPSGVYLVRLVAEATAGPVVHTRRITLMK